jgi:hypothetical protein
MVLFAAIIGSALAGIPRMPWYYEESDGCCREQVKGTLQLLSHQDTAEVHIVRRRDAFQWCQALCTESDGCNAFEVHRMKEFRRKKQTSCEIHSAHINTVMK